MKACVNVHVNATKSYSAVFREWHRSVFVPPRILSSNQLVTLRKRWHDVRYCAAEYSFVHLSDHARDERHVLLARVCISRRKSVHVECAIQIHEQGSLLRKCVTNQSWCEPYVRG